MLQPCKHVHLGAEALDAGVVQDATAQYFDSDLQPAKISCAKENYRQIRNFGPIEKI